MLASESVKTLQAISEKKLLSFLKQTIYPSTVNQKRLQVSSMISISNKQVKVVVKIINQVIP